MLFRPPIEALKESIFMNKVIPTMRSPTCYTRLTLKGERVGDVLNTTSQTGQEIARAYNSMWSTKDAYEFAFPYDAGRGSFNSTRITFDTILSEHRMSFGQDMSFAGGNETDETMISFCLSNGLEWHSSGNSCYQVSEDQAFIWRSSESDSICFPKGNDYHFISIKMPTKRFSSMVKSDFENQEIKALSHFIQKARAVPLDATMKMSIYGLLNCPYLGGAARMYSEGKILEVMSGFVSGALDTEKKTSLDKLSRSDRSSIEKAKSILDHEYASPPTNGELAKRVLLSETRLSRGFKTMYGTSLHAYAIQRRLEEAYDLLHDEDTTVSAVAYLVGYGNISHFSAAFHKKYGIYPSDITRHQ